MTASKSEEYEEPEKVMKTQSIKIIYISIYMHAMMHNLQLWKNKTRGKKGESKLSPK